jgi:hypothetical protein
VVDWDELQQHEPPRIPPLSAPARAPSRLSFTILPDTIPTPLVSGLEAGGVGFLEGGSP